MAAELNMFQAQAGEYRYEIERLNTELGDVKRQYYETKRRESLTREVGTRKSLRIKDTLSARGGENLNISLPDIPIGMPRSTRHIRQRSHRLTGGGFPLMSI